MEVPKHIAFSLDDISDWCSKNGISIDKGVYAYFNLIPQLMYLQVKNQVPILTIYLLPDYIEKSGDKYLIFCDSMGNFFNGMANNEIITKHKIKISVFGKWYNLPGKAVEAMKKVIESTKEYDSFFFNFCINYDGQEEIVDACKLIAKQVELGKIYPEMITKETIKENIYSSYFLPPDVIVVYGERKLGGFLMWDSPKSKIVFADKSFIDFKVEDFEKLNLLCVKSPTP